MRGNVLWLSLVSLLNDTASEMIYPLLPRFLVGTLRGGAAVLGAIEGAAETTASLLKLASGWISDRVGRRKPLVIAGYGIAALARPLVAIAAAPWHILAIRLADRAGKGVRTAPRDALLAESVPPEVRGRAFGVHRAADHVGAVLGPLLASALLFAFSSELRLVFALAAVPGLLAVMILVRVREQPIPVMAAGPAHRPIAMADQTDAAPDAASRAIASTPPRVPPRISLQGLDATFLKYLAAVFVFTLGNATDAFLLLRASQLGVPDVAIPLLWGAHHVSKAIWSVPGGALADRVGARHAIVGGWFVYAGAYAGFAVASSSWHVWALFLIYGLFYGLTEAPEKALVAALSPAGTRGQAFGAYHFAIGIGALPASLGFGAVWQLFGPATAFLMGAALAFVAATLVTIWVPARTGRTPEHA